MLVLVCSVEFGDSSVKAAGVVFEGERSYTKDKRDSDEDEGVKEKVWKG